MALTRINQRDSRRQNTTRCRKKLSLSQLHPKCSADFSANSLT
jgi:hypothetical protein